MNTIPIFARFHFYHGYGYHGGNGGPLFDWLGKELLWLHDRLPNFLPEWTKWTLIFGPMIVVLAWLILKWQRSPTG